jgi:anti-sigma B factor antagonist
MLAAVEIPVRSTLGEGGAAIVRVLGAIDFSNADDVSQGLRDAVEEWSPAELRVDLTKATFIDSTGLGALIDGYRTATAGGCRFVVVNPTALFRRVLAVTGLCELFGLADDEGAPGRQAARADSAS